MGAIRLASVKNCSESVSNASPNRGQSVKFFCLMRFASRLTVFRKSFGPAYILTRRAQLKKKDGPCRTIPLSRVS